MTEIDEKTSELYSEIARLQFETQKARVRVIAEQTNEPLPAGVQEALDQTETYNYAASTAFGGLFFMTIDTTLTGTDYTLSGLGGGLGFGAAVSWGTAYLNYTIESIVGWEFRFEANLGVSVVNINWWGMKGEYIGSFAGAGIAIAAGVFGGKGSISD